jgi:peptidoglycan/LPS O-acetylase OafA/YrhL
MSLAPREQRLLARIEHTLRSTDPRLARMLATFRLPAFRGGLAHLCRSRGRDFAPPAIALVAIALIICCGLLLGHASPTRCTYRGIAMSSAAACRASGGTARQPSRKTGTHVTTSSVTTDRATGGLTTGGLTTGGLTGAGRAGA